MSLRSHIGPPFALSGRHLRGLRARAGAHQGNALRAGSTSVGRGRHQPDSPRAGLPPAILHRHPMSPGGWAGLGCEGWVVGWVSVGNKGEEGVCRGGCAGHGRLAGWG